MSILRRHEQRRGFRLGWGWWISHIDPESRRDARRHQRLLRHKYAEAVNRKLSWEQHPQTEEAKRLFKHMVGQHWRDTRSPGVCGKYTYVRRVRTPENLRGVRPGQNIEDVERGPMERLLFGDNKVPTKEEVYTYDHWSSPLQNIRNYFAHRQQHVDARNLDPGARGTEIPNARETVATVARDHLDPDQDDYYIDAITNRKVFKKASPPLRPDDPEVPVRSFKKYRAQFTQFKAPIAEDNTGATASDNASRPVERREPHQTAADSAPWQECAPPVHSDAQQSSIEPVAKEAASYAAAKSSENEVPEVRQDNPSMESFESKRRRSFPAEADSTVARGDEPPLRYEGFAQNGATDHGDTEQYRPDEFTNPKVLFRSGAIEQPGLSWHGVVEPGMADERLSSTSSQGKHAPETGKTPPRDPGAQAQGNQRQPATPLSRPEYSCAAGAQGQARGAVYRGSHRLSRRVPDLPFTGGPGQEQSEAPAQSAGDASKREDEEVVGRSQYRTRLESFMSRLQKTSDAADTDAAAAVRLAKEISQQGDSGPSTAEMTGNYVRDFPEEFAMTWTDSSEAAFQPKEPAIDTFNDSRASLNSHDFVPLDAPPPNLQPSLDRHRTSPKTIAAEEGEEAPMDHVLTGQKLEVPHENSSGVTPPTYAPRRAATSREGASVTDDEREPVLVAATTETREPTTYKILAYDPTMQIINTAETTSVVADTAAALTPAEVLLRLSNPAKFFPHFAPLQAQGFEIVSGSGDVLIFRKVHEAVTNAPPAMPVPTPNDESRAAPPFSPPQRASAPSTVNPIDMTGNGDRHVFPASANFASPTGYVNYDLLAMDDDLSRLPPPPPPPVPEFYSKIGVTREGTVSSRPKHEHEAKTRKSVGRRVLVGALWVGSVSYALGVVGEYFKTGGIDGMGPKGL